jgi:N-acetylglucosaminyl-diphospho-decaprenol L-rhamnosyltransferase
MKAITGIIVGYNSRDSIERALQSIFESRGLGEVESQVEVIVVDNASSDGTADLVRKRFPNVRLIEPGENLGFGRACNVAAGESESDYILLLNPDAWLDPECLIRLRTAMEADAKLAWASPLIYYPDGRRQFNWAPTTSIFGEALQKVRNRFESRRWVHHGLPRVMRTLGDAGWFTGACALIRREAWQAASGFDPGFFLYFEDADLGLRLRRAGWRLAEVEDAFAHHDRHGLGRSSETLTRYRESQRRYYEKHRPRWESRSLAKRQRRVGARRVAAANDG